MFEKVNPKHPDKIADRIAGAIVDLAYMKNYNPKIAVEVLIGHGNCTVIVESDTYICNEEVTPIVKRISECEDMVIRYVFRTQDKHLNDNQKNGFKCGDNGIFKGCPVTKEAQMLTDIASNIYKDYPYDGKYILDANSGKLILCQSNADDAFYNTWNVEGDALLTVNPLGDWTGGTDVDTGATNRKLGSDMGGAVTGGGLHGKDLSKADVSVNIYAHLKAQESGVPVELFCAIGDDTVDGKPYSEIVGIARAYIESIGGFEKFAEWGLIRPEKEG